MLRKMTSDTTKPLKNMKTENDELIIKMTDFEILLDFMPEWNLPTGDSKRMTLDWNTLMPVVEKIAGLMPSIKIPEDLEALKNGTHGSEPYVEVISLSISSPIEDIYKAVLEFIKWYNSPKP